MYKILTEEAHN